jgi:hypothetical protein
VDLVTNFDLEGWEHVLKQEKTTKSTHTATLLPATMISRFLLLFLAPFVNSMDPAHVMQKIQDAIKFHKAGDFSQAIDFYNEVIPHTSGKTKSQLSTNAGTTEFFLFLRH